MHITATAMQIRTKESFMLKGDEYKVHMYRCIVQHTHKVPQTVLVKYTMKILTSCMYKRSSWACRSAYLCTLNIMTQRSNQ